MNRGIEIDNSLYIEQSLRNEAHRRYGELVAKKIKEIKPSYTETPEFKRAIELVNEAREVAKKLANITKEYHTLTGGNLTNYCDKTENSVIWDLSKGNSLGLSISGIIQDNIAIKMATPGISAEHCLAELVKIIEEELSHIK